MLRLANRVLAVPSLFDTYQSLIGVPRCHRELLDTKLRPLAGERVVDIGCGVGATARLLAPDIDYTGIDIDEGYIEAARRQNPRRSFIALDIASANPAAFGGQFDRAFAFGVLHHLPDDVAAQFAAFVRRAVKPGGRLVTIDPCYVPGQHPVSKFLIDGDRGRFVRNEEGFRKLLAELGTLSVEVRHDMLRVPFSQIIMTVDLPAATATAPGRASS